MPTPSATTIDQPATGIFDEDDEECPDLDIGYADSDITPYDWNLLLKTIIKGKDMRPGNSKSRNEEEK